MIGLYSINIPEIVLVFTVFSVCCITENVRKLEQGCSQNPKPDTKLSKTIPISALKYQLCGMASTLCMHKITSPQQWQPWTDVFLSSRYHISLRIIPISNPFYPVRGGSDYRDFLHPQNNIALFPKRNKGCLIEVLNSYWHAWVTCENNRKLNKLVIFNIFYSRC